MNYLALSAAAAAATAIVSVSEASAEWTLFDTPTLTAAYSSGETAVLLGCDADGKPQVVLSTDEVDFEEVLTSHLRSARTRRGRLMVEGEEVFNGPFLYRPRRNTAETNSPKAYVKLFNAAVQGTDVSIKLNNIGTYDLEIPEVDDAFTSFASTCRSRKS